MLFGNKNRDVIARMRNFAADGDGIIILNPAPIKVGLHDAAALKILEQFGETNYTVGECTDILNSALFWLVILNTQETAIKEIEEGSPRILQIERKRCDKK